MIQSHRLLLFYRIGKIFHHRIREQLFTHFFCDLFRFLLAGSVHIEFNELANADVSYALIAKRMCSVFYCLSLRIED